MTEPSRRTAVITGASSGIGAATARALAAEGFAVVLGARRIERLEQLAGETGGRALPLDVTDAASVEAFAAEIDSAHVLINNAGLASGRDRLADLPDSRAEIMWKTNVMGLLRVTRALLGALEASGAGHIVNIGSTAGIEAYPGGGGYTATKYAVRAITQTLRLELHALPIRVSEVAPGAVETEFSVVRFDGSEERAAEVYEGYQPLTAEDVAECVRWVVTRPPHVNVDHLVVRPTAQANTTTIARSEKRD